ncbi:acyl-CoA dehydrogenase [Egibacter rhizosphaerae]|uniref:Acyl-CoA dehydrogenase n=1 Tax=Egibacter rhizosphaerae TaxID=1670831 RepID=A0A411YCZ2_9ACTN|nr:acyl-CoA dehydrogenase family protein [Egibacter rhizosphaerae]QBI19101.1 acyl-CoA dehydrogenase [Egibacter rhizosphaerae]
MDLRLTDQQQAFRDEVREWLATNVPAEALPPSSTAEGLEAHRAWERRLYEAGYAAIHWPTAYGGRDADLLTQAIFSEEYARAGAPHRINVLALGLAGPVLIDYGTEDQKRRWLPGILSCDEIWSQGFSEPDAGSDLAALKTTAVREGDELVVNGQKIWTTLGRFADWIFALVRTNRDAPKHQGITFVMIPMDSPGIEVRPIMQINEDPGFSEVFFSDVRVPVDHVVGEIDDGWRIAMATLGYERGTGLGNHVRFSQNVDELIALARAEGADRDPLVRDRIAQRFVETEVFRHHTYRGLTRMASGEGLGPEASLNKLYWSEMETRIFEDGLDLMGASAQLSDEADTPSAVDEWHKRYWYARASRIYAGTSEIQKNIIAERVLGLPKEPRG